jgi:hypothetical protein
MRMALLAGLLALMTGAFTGCSDSKTTGTAGAGQGPAASGGTGTGAAPTMIGPRGRIPAPPQSK